MDGYLLDTAPYLIPRHFSIPSHSPSSRFRPEGAAEPARRGEWDGDGWRMEWGAAEPRVSMSVGVSRLPPSLATGSAYGKGILIIHKVTGTDILYLVPTVSLPVSHLTLLLTPIASAQRVRRVDETRVRRAEGTVSRRWDGPTEEQRERSERGDEENGEWRTRVNEESERPLTVPHVSHVTRLSLRRPLTSIFRLVPLRRGERGSDERNRHGTEKRAEHNQIRTFILPSWLLPLWPNRLTPRDRGVRWVKGTEHRWNELRPTRQVKREQHEDSLRSCCWPSHSFTVLGLVMSPLPLTSHPVGTREPSGVSPRYEWWTTWGEWVRMGRVGGGRWVSRRPVSSRSGMRSGGTRVTVRPSLYVSFPFSPSFTPYPRRRRYAVRTEWRGDGKEPRHDGRSVERPHPIHIPLLTTKGRLRRWEEGDRKGW